MFLTLIEVIFNLQLAIEIKILLTSVNMNFPEMEDPY